MFWLIVVAFLAGILRVLGTALELAGILPESGPAWYAVFQGVVGVIQFGIGLALLRGYQRAGVWGPVSRSSFPPRTRSPSPHDYEKEESPRGG
jgi:hypothetical protein